jgi:thiamine-monophosphate kinase
MEFDLIDRIRQRAATRDDVVLGIGDDAAILQVPADSQLVVAMDTLNSGVHFPESTAPADIGWKSLAVNLSDLAAMGARPAWCTLSLSLPTGDAAWLDAFLDGFLALAARHDVALVGGDTTHGPLSVCVAVHGLVAPGRALRRDAARVGDEVWITGTAGDAAAALWLQQQGRPADPALRERLDRPRPRVASGLALAGFAHACIDVSDGVLADLGHICTASGVAAEVRIDDLPASAALAALAVEADLRRQWQAAGGDDYELCFTAPAGRRDDVRRALASLEGQARCIGAIVAGEGVRAHLADGTQWVPGRAGYRHFAG